MTAFRVIVIGGGIAGAGTAFALARRRGGGHRRRCGGRRSGDSGQRRDHRPVGIGSGRPVLRPLRPGRGALSGRSRAPRRRRRHPHRLPPVGRALRECGPGRSGCGGTDGARARIRASGCRGRRRSHRRTEVRALFPPAAPELSRTVRLRRRDASTAAPCATRSSWVPGTTARQCSAAGSSWNATADRAVARVDGERARSGCGGRRRGRLDCRAPPALRPRARARTAARADRPPASCAREDRNGGRPCIRSRTTTSSRSTTRAWRSARPARPAAGSTPG